MVRGAKIKLTNTEFDVLWFLLEHRDRVLSPAEISRHVFGRISGDVSLLVRVHICHLRRALGPEKDLIVTLKGRGYQAVPAAS